MRWKLGRQSENVVDVRGSRPGIGGLGIGGIVVVVVIGLFFGKSPLEMLGLLSEMNGAPTAEQGSAPPADDESSQYEAPRLVLFSGAVRSACGSASSATGPFYCPADHQVYLDMSFFKDMESRLGGGGDFASAYVIAHEVGHHVQALTGVTERVASARQSGQAMEGSGGLSVRMELQADCYAGVWAFHAQQKLQWLESGDLEEALNTATAIGDDRLQQQSQGQVVPDAFTHGTSAQRVHWFRQGFESGNTGNCDTFSARAL